MYASRTAPRAIARAAARNARTPLRQQARFESNVSSTQSTAAKTGGTSGLVGGLAGGALVFAVRLPRLRPNHFRTAAKMLPRNMTDNFIRQGMVITIFPAPKP